MQSERNDRYTVRLGSGSRKTSQPVVLGAHRPKVIALQTRRAIHHASLVSNDTLIPSRRPVFARTLTTLLLVTLLMNPFLHAYADEVDASSTPAVADASGASSPDTSSTQADPTSSDQPPAADASASDSSALQGASDTTPATASTTDPSTGTSSTSDTSTSNASTTDATPALDASALSDQPTTPPEDAAALSDQNSDNGSGDVLGAATTTESSDTSATPEENATTTASTATSSSDIASQAAATSTEATSTTTPSTGSTTGSGTSSSDTGSSGRTTSGNGGGGAVTDQNTDTSNTSSTTEATSTGSTSGNSSDASSVGSTDTSSEGQNAGGSSGGNSAVLPSSSSQNGTTSAMTATTTATTSAPANIAINDSTRFVFSDTECVMVKNGEYYCVKPDRAPTDAAPTPAPLIDGVIARADSEGDKEIYYTHDGTTEQITSNSYDDDAPVLDKAGGLIVWHALIKGRYQIFAYVIASKATLQLTDTSYNNQNPYAENGTVVWQGWVDEHWQIFAAQHVGEGGLSITQLTHDDTNSMFPKVNEGLVTWQSAVGGAWQVNVYNFATGETSHIAATEGSYENPRYVLLMDNRKQNGDVEHVGYDIATGETIDLGTSAHPLSIPASPAAPLKSDNTTLPSNESAVKTPRTDQDEPDDLTASTTPVI